MYFVFKHLFLVLNVFDPFQEYVENTPLQILLDLNCGVTYIVLFYTPVIRRIK